MSAGGTASTRRAFLALGLGSAGALLVGASATAASVGVVVDGLAFDVPADLRPVARPASPGGPGWAWSGARDEAAGTCWVLARADLASTDPEEVVGWLLAAGLAGALPGLTVASRRSRSTPGGGEQARLDVAYGPAASGLRGTLLVATRASAPAGVLLVLGDERLTAGEVAAVLDSARWVR